MELEQFYTLDRHNDGAEIQLKDESGNLTECFLKVVGPDSDIWREALSEMQRDALMASFAESKDVSKGERRAKYLSRAVLDWKGFTDKDDKPAEFDQKRVNTMFIMAPYIADQVDKFVGKRENFMKPSAKS